MNKKDFFNDYKYGFVSDIPSDTFEKGLSEEIIKAISKKRDEPQFILQFRLDAYRQWKKMKEPSWAYLSYPKIDYQNISYYSAPKVKKQLNSLKDADPEMLKTLEKLNIPIDEQKKILNVAVDIVFDSVSIGVAFREKLKKANVILCSLQEAIKKYPELIKKYLGSVVSPFDNYFTALNSAVFSDGSFVFVPKGVKCPIELSTYFRINEKQTGQFERTLIIAEKNSSLSYLEGCTAPAYDDKQLHGAVVEIIALDQAEVKYSTVQNWYAGDKKTGNGGIYNFVTKRGLCKGEKSKISWTQVEVGASITWKYPSCILEGDNSVGEFYSITLTNGKMQSDTGTKMIHIGKNTVSTIISKGISADDSSNSYRGKVKIMPSAIGAKNYSQCDSLLIGEKCHANTFPDIEVANDSAQVEHEAFSSKINEEQLFYLKTRGMDKEEAIRFILGCFCSNVIDHLPLEFAEESKQLLALKLEGTVG